MTFRTFQRTIAVGWASVQRDGLWKGARVRPGNRRTEILVISSETAADRKRVLI